MNPLRIAIVGMGLVGSYLINQLKKQGHSVVGYERYQEKRYECICAWAASRFAIREFAEKCGLSFDDYILHEGRTFKVQFGQTLTTYKVTGLVTFDKHRMIMDMQKGHDIIYGRMIRDLDIDCDLIIDSTGVNRAILPKTRGTDLKIPVVLYRARFDEPPFEDFYLKIFETNSGYFWYFPLGNGEAHIGVGDYFRHHQQYLNEFLEEFKPMIIKRSGRPIRLSPPSRCEPFFSGKIVGVGESIGTVFPLSGEGMIPSLQCADIFIENIYNLERYRAKVLDHFRIFDDAGTILQSMLSGRFSLPDDLIRLARIGNEFYFNSTRYGISLNPTTVALDLKSLLPTI